MNWDEIKDQKEHDERHGLNSLCWIKPIAENMLMHMSSDELYEFIEKTLVAKQLKLAEKLLKPKED